MHKPIPLSDTARLMLSVAAERDNRQALPPERLPVAAQRSVVQSLLKAGLLEEIAAEDDGPAWRTTDTGERLALRATESGLEVVGRQRTERPEETPTTVQDAASTPVVADTEESASEPAATVQPATSPTRPTLRTAGSAVLAAWDDSAEGRPALADAVSALRIALTGQGARLPSMPHQPRSNTKRAAVLTLLRRPDGATVAQVAEATGWASHSVRGFFAGLKKAGTPVEVLERVRQVGPSKEGAKGSYTVYHVAEAG